MAKQEIQLRPLVDPRQLSDEEATVLGKKEYTAADGATVTGNNSWSTQDGYLIPYQMQDGSWRMRFNIAGTVTGNTSVSLTFTGVTFFNTVGGEGQAISAFTSGSGAITRARVNDGDSGAFVTSSVSATSYTVSGDVKLASKPSWAD